MTGPFPRRWSRPSCAGRLLVATFGVLISVAAGRTVEAHTAEEAQAFVERAAAHIQVVGAAQGLADITRPDGGFVDGDLYVFCDGADGTVLAHGGNPKLVGKNLSAVRDSAGTLPTAETFRIGQTKGQGWVEYLWPNPLTRRIEHKVTYVLRIDDWTVCGSGFYKTDPP